MKQKTKLLKQREIIEDNKTFDEILEEIKQNVEILATEYIPKLCTALKRQYPLMNGVAIRTKVISAVSKPIGPWKESTIRTCWPQWMKNEKKVEHAKQQWQSDSPPRGKISKVNFETSQDDQDKEEEQTPVSSQTIFEYEETHPKTEETPFQALGEINRAIARLWTALTGNPNMAHMEDNIKKEHIIPTRERFKDIMNGSSKVERDFLFNWLTWLNQVVVDRIDLIEKSDKTAYDTRE
jgi:hypothetical protein